MSNKSINKGLQTLVGGALSPTSSVTGSISTINFNKYYTKDEIDRLFEDLEISRNGDMHKEVYDTNNDGKVDSADLADEATVAGKLKTPVTIASVEFDGSANIELTKENIGLGNVDNTSDLDKPISIATQEALDMIRGNAQVGVTLGTVDAKADANTTEINAVKGKVYTADGKITALEELTASQGEKITTVENKAKANATAITAVEERVTASESEITALKATTDEHGTRLTSVEQKSTANADSISSLKGDMTSTQSKVSLVENRLESTEGKISILGTKLEGIEEGAEVNQNAFSNVKVGSTTIKANSKTDALEIIAGENVTITPNAENNLITISSKNDVYVHPNTHDATMIVESNDRRFVSDAEKEQWNAKASTDVATQTKDGLMSSADKIKLDSIGIGGNENVKEEIALHNADEEAHPTLVKAIDEKISVNGVGQNSINFVENKLVQDGYLFSGKTSDSITYPKISIDKDELWIYTKIDQHVFERYAKIFNYGWGFRSEFGGETFLSVGHFDINSQKIKGGSFSKMPVNNNWIIVKVTPKSFHIWINGHEIQIAPTNEEDFYEVRNLLTQGYAMTVKGVKTYFAYTRELTQREIKHNLSVINNAPSIKSLEVTNAEGDKTTLLLATDTDHVQNNLGRTQEEINQTFYKGFGKEFTSNGEDIIVGNGLKGSVLKGKLEGQTVNNLLDFSTIVTVSEKYPIVVTEKHNDNSFTFYQDKYNQLSFYIYPTQPLKMNKTYTIFYKFVSYTQSSVDGMVIRLDVNNVSPKVLAYKRYSHKVEDFGILQKQTFTLNQDFDSPQIQFTAWDGGEITERTCRIDNICLVEGDGSNISIPVMDTSLSSTKAIISHNDVKYPFYATEEDKVQGKVIELNKVGDVADTLEMLEDGNGVYTKNIGTTTIHSLSSASIYGTHEGEIDTICFSVGFDDSKNLLKKGTVLCDKLPSGFVTNTDKESVHSHANGVLYIRILRNRLETLDVDGLKKWLEQNPLTISYTLINPVVYPIPKELMPVIPTSDETIKLPSSMLGVATLEETHEDNDDKLIATLEEPIEERVEQMDSMFTQEPMVTPLAVISNPTGLFSFGENVKPSKVTITVPVVSSITELDTIVTQHSADITAIDKKVTTNTSNINSLKTTVNGYGTRLTTAESNIKSLQSKVDVDSVSQAISDAIEGLGESINLPITTSDVVDSLGKTQDEINESLYKGFSAEFVSNGEDIVLDDVIGNKVYSAKLEGQTVKNEILSECKEIDLKNDIRKSFDVDLVNTKTYTLIISINNLYNVSDSTESELNYLSLWIPELGYPYGEKFYKGVNKTLCKLSEETVKSFLVSRGGSGSIYPVFDYMAIIEGDWTNKDLPFNEYIPSGFNSTKAVVSNNGEKHVLYASEEDKLANRPIELNGIINSANALSTLEILDEVDTYATNTADAVDTFEILEDGSGILTKAINEYTITGQETVRIYRNINDTYTSFNIVSNRDDLPIEKCYGAVVTKNTHFTDVSFSVPYLNKEYENLSVTNIATSKSFTITIKNERLSEVSVNGMKQYLLSQYENGTPIKIKYETLNPTIIHIPKELIQTIPTQESNAFSFGEEVKPSKAMVKVAVGKSTDLSKINEVELIANTNKASITSLDSKVKTNTTSISTLKGNVTTLQNEVGNTKSKMEEVEGKATTNASDIATIKDNITTLESEIARGLAKILEALV